MIYTYSELINNNLDDYKLKKMLDSKELYKIDNGIYSKTPYYDYLEYITKKYPNAIFNDESAFYYLDMTDSIPLKYYLATSNNSRKINNKDVKQTFMSNRFFDIGKTQIVHNNTVINIYDKERMLIELVRNRNNYSFAFYKEIISNYRKMADKINIRNLRKYLEYFKNSENIFDIIHREVF